MCEQARLSRGRIRLPGAEQAVTDRIGEPSRRLGRLLSGAGDRACAPVGEMALDGLAEEKLDIGRDRGGDGDFAHHFPAGSGTGLIPLIGPSSS